MENQRFVQQNVSTTTQSPSTGRRPAEAPAGKTRSGTGDNGRFEVRLDPPQSRVKAPRSRAERLAQFVAQFQADKARQDQGNVAADLAAQTSVPPMTNRAAPEVKKKQLPKHDQQKVDEAIRAIDLARRQFSHAAAISRQAPQEVLSTKTPHPTGTPSGIVSTMSQAIASEVSQVPPATVVAQPKVAPVAAIRQPFFAKPTMAPTTGRPEVVFENAAIAKAPSNPAPLKNLAIRQKQETEVVELPESLLREIADQHRQFEAEEGTDVVAAEPVVTEGVVTGNAVSNAISVDLAAWDVEAFRWTKVTDDILTHADHVMDLLTHYSLDILTGKENRIGVAGLTRGQGASTIAAAVARWAVSNGKRVLLVDADLANPQLSRSAGLSPNVSWLNLIREDLIPSEAIIRSKSTGICIMPLAAVVTPQSYSGHVYDRLGGLLEQVRHGFDMILVDVGPVGQLSSELSNHALMLDALMIVDENPSSGEFLSAKSKLLKSGVRKFIAAQNSTGSGSL